MVYSNNYCSIEDAWGNLTGPLSKDKKKKKKVRDPICELYDMSANASYDELEVVNAANSIEFDKYNKSKYQRDRQAAREKPKYLQIDASSYDDHVPLYEQKVTDDMDLDKQFASSATNAQCSKSKIRMPDFESHFNPLTAEPNDDDEESVADFKEFKHILNKKKQEDFSEGEEEEEAAPPKGAEKKRMVSESFTDDDYYGVPMRNSNAPQSNMAYLDLILYIVSGMILIFVMEQFVKIGLMLQQ